MNIYVYKRRTGELYTKLLIADKNELEDARKRYKSHYRIEVK